jgi:hypothetical protein
MPRQWGVGVKGKDYFLDVGASGKCVSKNRELATIAPADAAMTSEPKSVKWRLDLTQGSPVAAFHTGRAKRRWSSFGTVDRVNIGTVTNSTKRMWMQGNWGRGLKSGWTGELGPRPFTCCAFDSAV